jgi:hypothetical protein
VVEWFGFQREALLRWQMPFENGKLKGKQGKEAKGLPPGSGRNDLWRDTVVLGLCWDDWAGGGAGEDVSIDGEEVDSSY